MQKLNLPTFDLKIKEIDDKKMIWDPFRSKYYVLTPEEWVRQNFLQFMIHHLQYPIAKMAVEKKVDVNGQDKRFDALVYDSHFKPSVIIEFKAPHIKLSQEVFEQAGRYNYIIKADYLIISNGMEHYCAKIDFTKGEFAFLRQIPHYSEL